MVERDITITNKLGLHARPSAQLVKIASKFKSEVSITRDDLTVNGKSIMGVMMLAAEMGTVLTFKTEGPDEKEAMDAIEQVIKSHFGEE